MKLVLQLGLIPGNTSQERAMWASDHGVDGIELGAWTGLDNLRRDADECQQYLPITSICGNCDVNGKSSFDFLDPDPAKRRLSLDGSIDILKLCGELGAVGQVVPPIFGPARVPDLSPYLTAIELEHGLMNAMLTELGSVAIDHKTLLLIEPLNRYEQHYLRTLQDGVDAVVRAGSPKGVGILADTFHMHIEEDDMSLSIAGAASYIKHVHLADNTRYEPGTGDIDFQKIIRALKESGFTGCLAYECSVRGETIDERRDALTRSLKHIRGILDAL